ncbi:hypothetical protein [Pontiella agarivorans]|uniref:DUF4136 domain-containing protein n=1 Tax=Pontiella agarivorans TaxID=3038953 RepID=A0ABU5MZY1_9BACT|nr:hypothetical protein [Pontiella agarivorans]MDZ8119732.1 hypothetical protein [Pontiella agarivorans]
MKRTAFTYALSAASILALSSCKMRTPRQESWQNPAFKEYKLGKTLVLATADSESRCMQYEALFVNQLLAYVDAGSLHASEQVTGKIDKDNLERILKANAVETLIVTSVLDGTSRDELVAIGYEAHPYSNDYWGYYNYGYALSANFASVSSYMEYVLETNVYDVKTKKLVWSGRKSIFDDRSDPDNMKIIINAVVHELKRKNMF